MAWLSTCNNTNHRVVSKSKYTQCVSDQWIPTGFVNGVATGFRREIVRLVTNETVEEWVGLTESQAKTEVVNGTVSDLASNGTGTLIQLSARRSNEANGWVLTKTTKVITANIT